MSAKRYLPEISNLIGFENDIQYVCMGLSPPNLQRLSLCIVGDDGLGKTAFAREICSKLACFCKVYIFLQMHRHYGQGSRISFLKKLIEVVESAMINDAVAVDVKAMAVDLVEVEGTDEKIAEAEQLKRRLCQLLSDKVTYLVLADDVRTTQVWDMINDTLPENYNGSRVIVTMQNSAVSYAVGKHNSFPFEWMRCFSQKECEELLLSKIFSGKLFLPLSNEMQVLAENLITRYGRLSLNLLLLGGLLSVKEKNCEVWSHVLCSLDGSDLEESTRETVFQLCYEDLPYPMKFCYLYIAFFPVGADISISRLSRLWIAEGFILGEETAVSYVDELLLRQMVQPMTWRIDGAVKSISIHKLMHFFCIKMARELNFFLGRRAYHCCGREH